MKKTINRALVCTMLAAASTAVSVSAVSASETEPMVIAPAPAAYTITANGKTVDTKGAEAYKYGDVVMIPVRAVAEQLGFTVTWDAQNQGIKLDNGVSNTTISIGDKYYYSASSIAIGMTAPTELGAEPQLVNGTTYVPAELFDLLYYDNNTVVVDGTNIKITTNKEDNNAQIPNPFVEYKTVEEAMNAVKFTAEIPSYIPEGYKLDNISVMSGEMLQLIYKNGEDEICFRTEKTAEDISGDYNEYKNNTVKKINGIEAKLRGNENIAGALWQNGDTAYSIYANKEISETEITKIAESVKDSDDEIVGMANPFVDYETLDEAKKAIKFSAKTPSYTPSGYKLDNISVMSGEMLQLIYKNGEDEICFRTEKTAEDISGDYNEYKNNTVKKINGIETKLRGNKDIAGAVWQDGDTAYSIYANKEISETEITKIAESLK